MSDNDDVDYAEENGSYLKQESYERAIRRRDPFYPPELHEQDVRHRFGWDEPDPENDSNLPYKED